MKNSPIHQCRLAFGLMAAVFLIALAAAFRFSTPLPGAVESEPFRLESGWSVVRDGRPLPIESLPCEISAEGETLAITRSLEGLPAIPKGAFAVGTRYESIRVWADAALVYEAAQGKEHALGSMWHFIPREPFSEASALTVELRRYSGGETWNLSEIYYDAPDSIRFHLIKRSLPALAFWVLSTIAALLLFLAAGFFAVRKSPLAYPQASLALFMLLSGLWILLDSKVTTLWGGNYALTYFLSYAAFYLLMVPYLVYISIMLKNRNRALGWLAWCFIGNAGVCLLLHLFGLVPIRNTAFTVHFLIVLTIAVSSWEFWKSAVRRKETELRWTFLGAAAIYLTGFFSIILYHLGALRPANSTPLFAWGLLVLMLCMTLDAVSSVSRFWKQKDFIDHYRRLAVQDRMTMLQNRNAFQLRLKELSAAVPECLAFVVFDLDNLKVINDQRGHHVGDQAIYSVARCIQEHFEALGQCYRIGGDEFCAVVPGRRAVAEIPKALDRFHRAIARQKRSGLPLDTSFGWASREFSEGEASAFAIQSLLREADRQMYENKQKKKGQVLA